MDQAKKERYQQRQVKKKEIVDAKIAQAQEERGIIIVLTGNGKGKSSSAFGTMARMVGHGKRVAVVQFTKGRDETGEYKFFKDHPSIDWHVMGHGFTWEVQDFDRDSEAAQAAWAIGEKLLADASYDMVIFDEMSYSIRYKHMPIEPVIEALKSRPHDQHVMITGRGMPKEILEIADTISEVRDERHAFHLGVKAQAGIEY